MSGRDITAALETALRAPRNKPFILIEGEFDAGPLRLWTGLGQLTWDGKAWLGTGGIIEISPAAETAELRASGGQITLNGLDLDILAIADAEPYHGRRITEYLGCFDTAGAIIVDPVILQRGFMDVMEPTDNGDTATVSLTIEARVIDFERARERRWTPEDQALLFTGDKGFDFVAALQDAEIPWGPGGVPPARLGK